MLVPFSKFSCLLQGMDRYFDEMCGNSQPQMFVYWVFTYRKMEINAWKTWRLAWYHCMASPCLGKNLGRFGLCRHAHPSQIEPSLRKFHAFEREITKIEGESKFSSFFALEFFCDEHAPCKSPCSNLAFFRAHLPYLGDYVHFLGI